METEKQIPNKKLKNCGNGSPEAGLLFAVSALSYPCPACIIPSITFLLNGLRGKLEGTLWK
jgi:hypothetical protein